MRIATLALIVLMALPLASCSSGFQEADIESVKKAIREQYDKDPRYSVIDVVLIKESANKLTGYVKLRNKLLGEFTRSCSATMAESGRDFLWRCGS